MKNNDINTAVETVETIIENAFHETVKNMIQNVNDVDFHAVHADRLTIIKNTENDEKRRETLSALNKALFDDYVLALSKTEYPTLSFIFNAKHYTARYKQKTGAVEFNPNRSIRHTLSKLFDKQEQINVYEKTVATLTRAVRGRINPAQGYVSVKETKTAFNDVCKLIHDDLFIRKDDIRRFLHTTIKSADENIDDVTFDLIDRSLTRTIVACAKNIEYSVNVRGKRLNALMDQTADDDAIEAIETSETETAVETAVETVEKTETKKPARRQTAKRAG